MDVHKVVLDVYFDSLGAFVVHYVERGCIPAGVEVGMNVCEHCNHGTIVFGRYGGKRVPHTHIACCGKIAWGKAPVLLVYIVPMCKSANATKQHILWVEHSSLVG